MNFNNHSNLEGQHAFLGASKYHWINYGEDKVAEAYRNFLATQKGTVLLLRTDLVLNPEYLIATTLSTHNAIHYGDEKLLLTVPNERRKNDTCPWRH